MLLINKKINFTQTTFTFMFYYFELFILAVPTKGGIQNMLQKTIFSTLFLAGSVLTITVNLIVLVLIIRGKQLQQVRFYIIANLLLGDIGLLTIQFLRKVIDLYGNQSGKSYTFVHGAALGVISYATYLNSILTTGLLAIDRYIAVNYTFHYEAMLTKRKILIILSFLWFLSAVIPTVLVKVSGPNFKDTYRYLIVSFIFFRLIVSLVLLGLSKYTYYIKKKHMETIVNRKNYFGVEQEKLDKLKSLKSSLKDYFKFYIANVAIMSVHSIIAMVELISSDVHLDIKLVVALLSQLIDIAVISLSYREIREQIKRIICKKAIGP